MLVRDYRNSVFSQKDALALPSNIIKSQWTIYHGTTNICEKDIDSNGLQWTSHFYSKKDVEELCNIFEVMDWYGIGSDSYIALKNYTLKNDFADNDSKPIYFTPYISKAIIYSLSGKAGGETARCIVYAIECLKKFLSNKEIQKKYRKDRFLRIKEGINGLVFPDKFEKIDPEKSTAEDCLEMVNYVNSILSKDYHITGTAMGLGHPIWKIDFDWLYKKILSLDNLYSLLKKHINNYQYSIVYCINGKQLSKKYVRMHCHQELSCFEIIHPKWIIAKLLISPKQTYLDFKTDYSTILLNSKGILRYSKPVHSS